MQGSKLTLHVQGPLPGWAAAFLKSGVQYVKLMDPPREDPCPGVRTIARVYLPDHIANGMVARGAAGADQWANWLRVFVDYRPWVHAWELPNEPPVQTAAERQALDEFTTRATVILHGWGLRAVGLNFSVGCPDWSQIAGFRRSLAVLDYLGLHEYGAPVLDVTGDDGRRCWVGRYRVFLQELRAAACRVPPIIIGEHGIDLGAWTPLNPNPRPENGWRSVNSDPRWYMQQLAWADANIYNDPIVEAVCLFTASPNSQWRSFEITEPLGLLLAGHVQAHPPHTNTRSIIHLEGTLPSKGQYGTRKTADASFVVLHHSATPNADTIGPLLRIRRIAEYHIRHWGWPGIGYHFVIDRNGAVYQTNDLTAVSNHAAGANLHGIGICLLGTYTKEDPPLEQITAAAELIRWLDRPAYDHSRWKGTVCPGRAGPAVRAAL